MPVNIPETAQKRVVIIGAGFAGLRLARKLFKHNFQVVLIDRNNYHQFQPLFYQVATSGLEPSSISFPLRKVFQKSENVFIRIAEVRRIMSEKKLIDTTLGTVWYDYLIIATGATTNFFGMESFETNSIPMKSVSEALFLRNTLLENFEKAVTIRDEEEVRRLLNIVVVGGGPTGVEVCGALAEMKKFVLPKDYPELDFNLMNITLVEANTHLLAGMTEVAGKKALDYLANLGVEVKLKHKVEKYDGNTVELEDQENLETRSLIWAAGVKGQMPSGIKKENVVRGNRIKVDAYNRIDGCENIFAIGDIAYMETKAYPQGHPQVAQVALQQANCLAENLKKMQRKKDLVPFKYRDKGSMATVGRNRAVVDLPHLRFAGFPAWLVWMFVHLMSIVGVKNRLVIFINWLWNYMTYDQSLRLIIRPSAKSVEWQKRQK
ncbi:NAD(P)/FAD-dependent oxidoreductase [Draconibacterium sediminis]|uniref:NADH:ubiquinone reductase (non-electrogenic) n=1 Tax=Draconibacterium sediminis TaxID=1544798 RepID=A0A0D8JEW9_9BACT|nr:NAD(P)/FAD-dependent oxidoreductase [Draconibacterium sediminis]KJF45460.1 NADH dehydrogenase [Draconibacterium sediminis]